MPAPVDTKLYAKVKAEADKKFLAPTSAYKSAWIVSEYKRRGGVYIDDGERRGLTQWFKEKWVDLERPKNNGKGYETCGRPRATARGTYPLCRPSKRVNSDTPKTVQEVSRKKIAQVEKEKQKVKYRGRVMFSDGK
jgi:ribosomal protein S14